MKNITCMFCDGKLKQASTVLNTLFTHVCVKCDCNINIKEETINLLTDKKFYIANYDTMENIEIFTSFDEAKDESTNDEVYEAILNHKNVWYENGIGWNYEDNSNLFITTPVKVKK